MRRKEGQMHAEPCRTLPSRFPSHLGLAHLHFRSLRFMAGVTF